MRAKSAGLLLLLGLIAPVAGCGTENETTPPVEQTGGAGGEAGTTTSPSPTTSPDAQGSAGEGGEGGEEGTMTSPSPTTSPAPGGEGGEGGEG